MHAHLGEAEFSYIIGGRVIEGYPFPCDDGHDEGYEYDDGCSNGADGAKGVDGSHGGYDGILCRPLSVQECVLWFLLHVTLHLATESVRCQRAGHADPQCQTCLGQKRT